MKKYLYGAIAFIVALIIEYFAISFCILSIDPSDWSQDSRIGFIVIAFFLLFLLVGIVDNVRIEEIGNKRVEKEIEEISKDLIKMSEDIKEKRKQLKDRTLTTEIDLSKLNKEDFKNL